MNLLLDTHIALWALSGDKRLSPAATALLLDEANTVCVSVVSFWEIALKHSLHGRAGMPCTAAEMADYARQAGYLIRNLELAHIVAFENSPNAHPDPFDRMLLAQALATPLRLVTHDCKLVALSDTIIFV